ncbi:hypothetical protein [Variovorax sp. W2I14]|uniref:hypothetical protein n=1 Tax=Variovorax sp. W2I14 TaxID=3042290 RepID=UPI003D2031D5
MTTFAAQVSELTKRLEAHQAEETGMKERYKVLITEMAETKAALGRATAELAIEQGNEVTSENLKVWFDQTGNGPAPEEILTKLLDGGQLSAVEGYVAWQDHQNYSKPFYLRLISESADFVELVSHKSRSGPTPFFSAFDELFEQKVLSTDLKERQMRHVARTNNLEVILKLAAAHHRNVLDHCSDFEMLKKLVAVNPKVMNNVRSDVTGRVLKMRELVAIAPKCAYFATSPITTNAGVGTRDSDQKKFTKVYNWLMSTGERKLIKAEVKAPEPTAQAPKKKFKI